MAPFDMFKAQKVTAKERHEGGSSESDLSSLEVPPFRILCHSGGEEEEKNRQEKEPVHHGCVFVVWVSVAVFDGCERRRLG